MQPFVEPLTLYQCRASTGWPQAWLGALAPALGQLRELGLEDCSLSAARLARVCRHRPSAATRYFWAAVAVMSSH